MEPLPQLIDPEIALLQTPPSSLGTVDSFIVIYDNVDFDGPDKLEEYYHANWIADNEDEISQTIDDDDFEHPIFVIHATASQRAEKITPLQQIKSGESILIKNVTSYGSACTTHCLAIKAKENQLLLKTGFHYWANQYNGPGSWETMDVIYDGFYKFITVKSTEFWPQYFEKTSQWKELFH